MNNHIRMTKTDSGSALCSVIAPEFNELDLAGWQGLTFNDIDLNFFIFNIDANASEFPVHSSEDSWIAYIISGSGTLYAGEDSGKRTESVKYRAGDLITFHPNTPHGWKNGTTDSRIILARNTK